MAVSQLRESVGRIMCEMRRYFYHTMSITNDFDEYLLLVPVIGSVLIYIDTEKPQITILRI